MPRQEASGARLLAPSMYGEENCDEIEQMRLKLVKISVSLKAAVTAGKEAFVA